MTLLLRSPWLHSSAIWIWPVFGSPHGFLVRPVPMTNAPGSNPDAATPPSVPRVYGSPPRAGMAGAWRSAPGRNLAAGVGDRPAPVAVARVQSIATRARACACDHQLCSLRVTAGCSALMGSRGRRLSRPAAYRGVRGYAQWAESGARTCHSCASRCVSV